ncbi:hypothetical protein [Blastopirellula marina]|uniref:Uncharacterized protein n=1 Tax=Blastopirellula marina DSM 3645 TaxID=314230 RepID=A3ZYX1_9BACT|nr:hypothetical protein [Blastopirellula marina]EAQ78332.1 hypothetical protein DSM3645_18386 [Blastopirellula marina DSM 3645]
MSSEPRIFDPDEHDDVHLETELPEAELSDEAWETAALPDDLLLLGDQLRCDATRLHESHRADRLQHELLRPERAQRAETLVPARGISAWLPLLWLLPVVLITAALVSNGQPTVPRIPASPAVAVTPSVTPQAEYSPQVYSVSLPAETPSQHGPSAAELDALLDLMQNETASVAVSL